MSYQKSKKDWMYEKCEPDAWRGCGSDRTEKAGDIRKIRQQYRASASTLTPMYTRRRRENIVNNNI